MVPWVEQVICSDRCYVLKFYLQKLHIKLINESNTCYKTTVHDRKPEHLGRVYKITVKPGDEYGLAVQ